MRSFRQFALVSSFFLASCLTCIYWIDRPLARFVNMHMKPINELVQPVIGILELIFGFPISKYLFGFMLLLIGGFLYVRDKNFSRANLFFFIALTHMASRLTAGMLKNVFLRLRPYEFLATGNQASDFWMTGGSSFPSGHTVHFFGLFLPLVYLYPNQKGWLILPVFVGLSRVLVNDHYLNDVLAAAYIAYAFTYFFSRLFKLPTRKTRLKATTV